MRAARARANVVRADVAVARARLAVAGHVGRTRQGAFTGFADATFPRCGATSGGARDGRAGAAGAGENARTTNPAVADRVAAHTVDAEAADALGDRVASQSVRLVVDAYARRTVL